MPCWDASVASVRLPTSLTKGPMSPETEHAVLGVSEALCRLLCLNLTPMSVPIPWREVLDERVLPLGALREPLPTFMWWERSSPGPRASDVHEFVRLVCERLGMGTREVVLAYVLVEQIVRNCNRAGRGLLRVYMLRKLVIGACVLWASVWHMPPRPRSTARRVAEVPRTSAQNPRAGASAGRARWSPTRSLSPSTIATPP